MVCKVLDSLQVAAQSKFDETEKKLEMTCKESEALQTSIEAAATTLATRIQTVEAAKTEHAERISARVAAKEALALAEQEQASGNAGLVVIEGKKQRLETS